MVEIVDGVLQFLEEALLVVTLRGDVGDLPYIKWRRLVAPRQDAGLQPVPVGAGMRLASRVQRLHQPEFLGSFLALVQAVGQAVESLAGFAIAR